MQVKIVIGTLAFMLTMIIFGYAALREPARLDRWAAASEAHKIEKGGDLFHSNCATCHGENGDATECYDANGAPQECLGLPLARQELLCPDVLSGKSARMSAMGWEGTLEGFIASTISAGRPLNGMPTWGAQFGGALEKYQVDYITSYVLNWRTDEICLVPTREPVDWPSSVADLPSGNGAAGETVYNSVGCRGCHGVLDGPGSNSVGPWVGEFAVVGPERVAGYSVADYVYESILLPNAHIAPDCPAGPCISPSQMPANFGQSLTLQDMADILAYTLNTTTFESNVEIEYP